MAFEIDPGQSALRPALRRILADQIGAALVDLDTAPEALPGRVHGLRKRTKKMRALLRMIGGRRRDLADLRRVAQNLAGLRDAQVMLETLLSLGAVDSSPLAARLTAARQAALSDPGLGPRLTEATALLQGLQGRLATHKPRARGFAVVDPGIRRAFSQAGALMERADADPGTEVIHDWRKRVKDHAYHARLFRAIWPEAMALTIATAGALEERLGQVHDLDILTGWLAAQPEAEEAASLIAAARRRRAALLAECRPLGARLLAGSAPDLSARWHQWWRAARREARTA